MTFPVIGADPGPLARLEAVKVDPSAPSVIFQRMTDAERPERLRDIARAWGLPAGLFVLWFTQEHSELYDQALRVRAGELVLDALDTADEATAETVAPARLQVDTRLKIASSWDRGRYGAVKDAAAGGGVTVVVDRSCGGTVQVAVKDAGGNQAAVQFSGTEASVLTNEGEI